MAGSTNFKQWNPTAANQENDAQYLADAQRTGGAASGPFPSATANKLFYQVSMMVAALGQMLANKGYAISDANFNNLVTALTNLVTKADLVSGMYFIDPPITLINWTAPTDWTDVDISGYIGGAQARAAILTFVMDLGFYQDFKIRGQARAKGSSATSNLPGIYNHAFAMAFYGVSQAIVPVDANYKFQTKLEVISGLPVQSISYKVNLVGYAL